MTFNVDGSIWWLVQASQTPVQAPCDADQTPSAPLNVCVWLYSPASDTKSGCVIKYLSIGRRSMQCMMGCVRVCVGPKLHHPWVSAYFSQWVSTSLNLICSGPVQVWLGCGAWHTLNARVSPTILVGVRVCVCFLPNILFVEWRKSVFIGEWEGKGGRRVGGKEKEKGGKKLNKFFISA